MAGKNKKDNGGTLYHGPGDETAWRNAERSESRLKGKRPRGITEGAEHETRETHPHVEPDHDPRTDDAVRKLRRPRMRREPNPTLDDLYHPELDKMLREFQQIADGPVSDLRKRAQTTRHTPDAGHYTHKLYFASAIVRDVYATYNHGMLLAEDALTMSGGKAHQHSIRDEEGRSEIRRRTKDMPIEELRQEMADALDHLFAYLDAYYRDNSTAQSAVSKFATAWHSPETITQELYIGAPLSELYANHLAKQQYRGKAR